MRGMGCATVAALFLAAPVAAQNPQDDAAAPQPDAAYAASMAEAAWDWQPGDLIFFHDDYYSSSTASHCGIYVGNDQFVHASTYGSGGVLLTALNGNPYYSAHYIAARRMG